MVIRLVRWSVAHRAVVVLVAGALFVAAFVAAWNSPLDVFPEFAPPIVEVQTEARGFSAADVEALVTTPLEQVLAGVPGITKVLSVSTPGLSILSVHFEYGIDPGRAHQDVTQRLPLA